MNLFLEVFISFLKSSVNTVSNVTSVTFFLSLTSGTPSVHMSYQYFSNYLWWICSPFIYNSLQTNSVIKYIKDFVAKSIAINICKYSFFLYLIRDQYEKQSQNHTLRSTMLDFFHWSHIFVMSFFGGVGLSFYSLCFNLLSFTNILRFTNLLFY